MVFLSFKTLEYHPQKRTLLDGMIRKLELHTSKHDDI